VPDPFAEYDRLTAGAGPAQPADPFAEYDRLLGQPRGVEQSAQDRLVETSAIAAAQEDEGFQQTDEPEQRLIRFNQIRSRYGLRDVQQLPEELDPVGFFEELGQQFGTARGLTEKIPFAGEIAVTASDALTLLPAAKRIEQDDASDEDYQTVVEHLQRQVEARRPRTFMGKVSGIASQLPTYGAEFAATGGAGTLARKAAGKALAKTVSKGVGQAVEKALAIRGIHGLTDVGAQVAVLTALKAPAQAVQRMFPEVRATEDHQVVVIPGEKTKEALTNAGFDTAIEVVSERSGAGLLRIGRFGPIQKLGGAARKKLGVPELTIGAKKFLGRIGYHGPLIEGLEERGGEALRQAVTEVGWADLPQEWPTLEQILAEQVAFVLPMAAGRGLSATAGRRQTSRLASAPREEKAGKWVRRWPRHEVSEPERQHVFRRLKAQHPKAEDHRLHGAIDFAEEIQKPRDPVLLRQMREWYREEKLDFDQLAKEARTELATYRQQEAGRPALRGEMGLSAAQRRLLSDYRQRKDAGQEDPAPSADAFKEAGYPDMTRRERREESQRLDQEATSEQAEETAGYSMATQGEEWTEEFPVTSGDATGNVQFLQQIEALEMPEMYQLASAILGETPTVRRLGKFKLGTFKPQSIARRVRQLEEDGYTEDEAREQAKAELEGHYGDILVDPSAAASEAQLAKVFGHELGHATDYMPDLSMGKGNILGRLASIRNYLKQTLDTGKTELTAKHLSQLYEEARERAANEAGFEQASDAETQRNVGITPRDVIAIWNAVADAPINKDLEAYIAKLSTADKKRIVGQALKGRVAEELQDFAKGVSTDRIKAIYENLVHEEIKKRQLFENDVRVELIGLSEWWKPYDVGNADPKYVRYRRSSHELYADALSVLYNTPGELQKRAPRFYQAFFDFLDRKPDVLDEYTKLQELLASGQEAVAEQRSNWVSRMFTRSRDRVIAANAAAKARQQSVKESISQKLEAVFVDTQISGIRRIQRGMTDKDFRDQVDAQNIEYLMSALQRKTGPAQAIVNATATVQRRLYNAGVTNDEIEHYLFYLNVADRRRGKASPLGFTPKTAQDQLDYLRQRMGPEKYDLMDRELRQWHLDTAMPIAEESVEVGNYSRETFETSIKPNAETYATFAVARHIAKDGGRISPGIHETVGTFEDILDPLQATTLKLISMRLSNMTNRAKREAMTQMARTGDIHGKPMRVTKSQQPKNPAPGFGWLYYRENGELYAAQVPKQVADMFSHTDLGRTEWLGGLFRTGFYKFFHPLFISYNPGFTALNPWRDTLRTWRDMKGPASKYRKREIERLQKEEGLTPKEARGRTAPMKISYADVWREWMKARTHAKEFIDGVTDSETVNRILASGALDVSYVNAAAETQDRPILDPRQLRFPGIEEEKPPLHARIKKSGIPGAKAVGGLMELVYRENMIQEAAGRIGGFELAGRFAKEDPTRGFFATKHSGTPDYRQRGDLTFLTNSLFPYSRVRWNDYQRQFRLLRDPDTRWGFLLRSLSVHLPSMALEQAAKLGLLGYTLKKMYELMPSVWSDNFFVIPIGLTAPDGDGDEEQVVAFTLPLDDTYTAWSKLVRTLIERESSSGIGRELVDLAKDLFVPSFNPLGSIPIKWAEFAAGRNPWDPFRDRPIIPRGDFDAGGWHAGRKMTAWTLNQFGVLSTLTYPATAALAGRAFEPGTDSTVEVFLGTAARATGAGRFIRWSGAGANESDWAEIEAMDQESAALRRSYNGLVQRLRTERWRLMKLQDTLEPERRARLERLKSWYSGVYMPRARAASLAHERGNTQLAEQIIADVDTITLRWFAEGS
jgi:hypothetical protein